MAAKKEETSKIILERTYVIPLRRETLKVPPFRKANKAVKTIQQFISRHMKSDNVAVGKYLNLDIWKHGAKNPPHKVKVTASKDDKGKVFVEIVGAPKVEEKKKAEKKEEEEKPTKPEEKIEKKIEEVKEEKAEEAKKIEQEEIKELQKEHPKMHAPKAPPKPKMQEAHPTAPKSV